MNHRGVKRLCVLQNRHKMRRSATEATCEYVPRALTGAGTSARGLGPEPGGSARAPSAAFSNP